MKRVEWKKPVSGDEAARRAGGRRAYNAARQINAELRRLRLSRLAGEVDLFAHGSRSALAQRLGVSRATVSRDLARIEAGSPCCPVCGLVTRPGGLAYALAALARPEVPEGDEPHAEPVGDLPKLDLEAEAEEIRRWLLGDDDEDDESDEAEDETPP